MRFSPVFYVCFTHSYDYITINIVLYKGFTENYNHGIVLT